jgi:hypothetical protein
VVLVEVLVLVELDVEVDVDVEVEVEVEVDVDVEVEVEVVVVCEPVSSSWVAAESWFEALASNPPTPPRMVPAWPARAAAPSYTKSTPWLMLRLNPSPGWLKTPPTWVTLQVAEVNPNVLLPQPPLPVMPAMGITPIPKPPPLLVIGTRSGSPKPVMVAPPAVHDPDPAELNVITPGHSGRLRTAVRLARAIDTSGFTAAEDISGFPDENGPVALTLGAIPIPTEVTRRWSVLPLAQIY